MYMSNSKTTLSLAFVAGAAIAMSTSCKKSTTIDYPSAPCDSTVYEAFGMEVSDPYRPLENDTAAATLAWVEAENAVTEAYLEKIPFREDIRERLNALNRYERRGAPSLEADGRYYFSANDGTKNQSVVYRMDSLGAEPEVFIDPNTLSDDGTVALTGIFFNKDGSRAAYTISRSGSDWTEIYVLDTATGELLSDHIEWAKFTGAAWDGNDGFYYSAYERPTEGSVYSGANEFHKVYYHRIGTPQSADRVVYENPDRPLYFHNVDVVGGGRWLAVYGGGQGHGNSLMVRDLTKPASQWITIEPSQDNTLELLEETAPDGCLLAFTSADAPRNRLVAIDPARPARDNWRTVIPEDSLGGVLASVQFAGSDRLAAVYDRDASHHGAIYNLDGEKLSEVALPTYGNINFASDSRSKEIFYTFSSFVYPSSIYTVDPATGESTLYHATEIAGHNPEDYITEQVFYTSADGTRVPMFTVRRRDVVADGSNPVYLYGYGGFAITLNPSFNPNRLLWLQNGGIYAQANLRGGNEYGEEWHEAGTKTNKLNVFNDFIAAGEYMVDNGWTKPELLTIEGGSNGGLLVGAVTNMRPDLFAVAIPRVGVMDMMRYHLFTIGWNWAHDYGTADDSEEMARYLLDYSPIHNISNDGTPYPAIMVTTADHDDRVVPAHSFKYAATLQAADTGSKPKLIRIDSKAGHGAGKPVSKVVDEYTDIYSFIYENIGVKPEAK